MALTREASVTGRLLSVCDAFTGLPEDAKDKYALIRMAERAGRHFGLGFTDLRLLTLYVGYTRPQDWERGGRPVYTRSVWRTASDLGISSRQVNRSENRLERLGLIFRDTRADGGRGTVREGTDEADRVVHCVDLRPLAVAWPALVRSAEAVRHREAAIDAARAGISRALRLLPRLLAEALTLDGPRAIAAGLPALAEDIPARTPRHRDLPRLVALHGRMSEAIEALRTFLASVDNGDNLIDPVKESDAADNSVSDINNTKPKSESLCRATKKPHAKASDLGTLFGMGAGQGIQTGDAEAQTGLDRLRPAQVCAAMPEDWRYLMDGQGRFSWRGYCHIAESRLAALGVGRHAWRRLTLVIGRRAAAVALMALEVNRAHPVKPVRNVGGAVFRFADIAASGGLRLDAMVIGILARQEEGAPVP